MKTMRFCLLLVVIFATLLAACGAPAAAAKLDSETVAEIEAILGKHMAESQVPGMAMCIVKGEDVVYSSGFGVIEVNTDTPVTPQSVFLMGSVSKSLTGVAIMQLVEQGKIDLDAPVTDYLPYFEMVDDRYKDITVRQLLSHKSGLYDEFGHELNDSLEPVEQAVRDLADQRLRSRPGKFYFYTGVGFALLGDIISKVSGMDFEDYMQENILVPLGMNHSTFVPEKADPELLFTPHTNAVDGSVVITKTELCDIRRQAECTLHSSCEDMMRFAMFSLNQGEIDGVSLLSHEGFDQMWTSHADTGGIVVPIYGPPIAQYGLSWQLGEVDGHRLVGHAGGGTGVNTQLLLAPDDDLAVITMANWAQEWPWPASFTAIEVMYSLLGVESEK